MNHRARELRRNQTEAEKLLWRHLRNRQLDGHKFRRQHPIDPYIVDFACLKTGTVVEIDGGQHMDQRARDHRRTRYLEALGFQVLRFWNNEVLGETEAVLERISEIMMAPHPGPLPEGEREI